MNRAPKYMGLLFTALIVISFILAGCGAKAPIQAAQAAAPAQQATTAPTTAPAPTAAATAAATTAASAAPTKAPAAAATAAPAAAATSTAPAVPAAMVNIVAMPGNPAAKGAITTTIKIITDTKVGPSNAVLAVMSTGLPNVPISVPVKIKASPDDPTWTGTKVTWSLLKPQGSKATLAMTQTVDTMFTPDLPGAYMVSAAFQSPDGKTTGETGAVQLHAGTYVGDNATNCKTCHGSKVDEWTKTGHAKIFTDMIDNKRTPDVPTHYTERCASCHTNGYYAAPYGGSGGFKDAETKSGWKFPTWAQIDAAGKGGPSNWANAPAAVKAQGNIQCEQCHGPASDHLKGKAVMAASQDEGVCNQCHNGGGHHLKGTDLKNSEHADASLPAWNEPTGPGEQQCVRCHSGNGYVSFLADPQNPAAWDNSKQTVVCSTCHDPHSEENMFQLRVVDKPVQIPNPPSGSVGLSATCFECHNSRVAVADYAKGSTPHYSSIAEMVSNQGGVTYGKDVPNSGHSMVGAAPIKNPDWKEGADTNQFMFSKVGDTKGNTPGACVTCHMWPTIEDAKNPNYHKVGSHSFQMANGDFDYTASCKQCHGDQTSFDFTAKADYDGNGKTEGVQEEVAGLLDVLWGALQDKGVKKIDTGYPYAALPKGADGKVDPKIQNAWINFRTVYGVMWGMDEENNKTDGQKGAPNAIHNFKRSVALLQLAYKDLTGQDVPKATILVK